VLVTGAGGFIGSHLVERLSGEGAGVRALLRYTSQASIGALADAVIDSVDLEFGDLRDPACVDAAVEGCDLVFHLGAQIAIPYSYRAPRDVVETNVLGTLNVLEAARRNGTA
jgi:dTDP-glucose 4,6-dehydratase